MERVTLTREQRQKVLEGLNAVREECGRFEVLTELDGLTVEAVGAVALDGYREDDYLTGTGAWVETYRLASVELTAYDEDGRAYHVDSDTEDAAYGSLNA